MEHLVFDANYEWVPVTDDHRNPYQFPVPVGHLRARHRGAAVYRWVSRRFDGTVESIYVGETDNLGRRIYGYLNPGPSQQTNLRMNDEFKSLVADDHVVTLEYARFESIRLAGTQIPITFLADKHVEDRGARHGVVQPSVPMKRRV